MVVSQADLEAVAVDLGAALLARGWLLATAESCTGGWVAQACTAIAGSSAWFERGFVTYSNAAKVEMLGVQEATLVAHGAVSLQTAAEMAAGALARSRAQLALAITGIAGPSGGSADKPVGTVCFGWAWAGGEVETARQLFTGDRQAIRVQSVAYVLRQMLGRLERMR